MNQQKLSMHPLKMAYWKRAFLETKELKSIVLVSILTAAKIALAGFYLPIAANVRIGFTFPFDAIIGLLFGPIMGVISGAITDLLGFILFPSGPFFPGYMVSKMLTGLIFGLLLYRAKKITVLRVFIARLIINIFVNAMLGSVWQMFMAKIFTIEFYSLDFSTRFLKNIILLPFEIIIILYLFKEIIPVLKAKNFLEEEIGGEITWK